MRSLVPAETLVYLETNDLAAALQPIVDSKPFTEVAKSKPDFSALRGVQLAVAVTGFETSEEKVSDEQSVGRIQPRFVAVADTHAWNYQAVAFAEQKLGSFVEDIYDSEPKLEKTDAKGGKYFAWTASDGRKAYALVIDSLIYFGNDESAIEKCLAVRRGEADSITKTNEIQPADPQTLASGYVSTDGVAQIANIIGLKFAKDASDDGEVQSVIADILPQLIRNTVTDVTWTSTKTNQGIEDRWQINMSPDISETFSRSAVFGGRSRQLIEQLPKDVQSVTAYDFLDPDFAFNDLIINLSKATGGIIGPIDKAIGPLFYGQYCLRSPHAFLAGTDSTVFTIKSEDSDSVAVIAGYKDKTQIIYSLAEGSRLVKSTDATQEIWENDADGTKARLTNSVVIAGDQELVSKLSFASVSTSTEEVDSRLRSTTAPIATLGYESESLAVVSFLSKVDPTIKPLSYFTETRFNKTGMERTTTSDFGFIGWIIAQMAQD